MTILIVEDNKHMRRMLTEMVSTAFPACAVLGAADAASALSICSEERPQLVLMDISLPDGNGIVLTAKIKALFPGTEVVIVSSHRSGIYHYLARAAGSAAYISKDEVHDKLLPALAAILQQLAGDTKRGGNP